VSAPRSRRGRREDAGMTDLVSSRPIPRRKIGATGLESSVLGFGSGDNAGLMVVGTPAERDEAVGLAIDAGVNYFDTAPS